jgi:hypothetical protein
MVSLAPSLASQPAKVNLVMLLPEHMPPDDGFEFKGFCFNKNEPQKLSLTDRLNKNYYSLIYL